MNNPTVRGSNITDESEGQEPKTCLIRHAKDLWKEGSMADTIVYVQNEVFPCHKAIVSCYSSLLNTTFSKADIPQSLVNACSGDTYQEYAIQLDSSIQPDSFRMILEYIYTGKLRINCQNVTSLYEAAIKLRVEPVLYRCNEIINNSPCIDRYLFSYVLREKFEPNLTKKALRSIWKSFERLLRSKQLVYLNFKQVTEILSGNEIGTRSEINVFLCGLIWLNHDYEERQQYAIDIMRCVRFSSIATVKEILACFRPPLRPEVVKIPEVLDMLLRGLCYVVAKEKKSEDFFRAFRDPVPRVLLYKDYPPVVWKMTGSDEHLEFVPVGSFDYSEVRKRSSRRLSLMAQSILRHYSIPYGSLSRTSETKDVHLSTKSLQGPVQLKESPVIVATGGLTAVFDHSREHSGQHASGEGKLFWYYPLTNEWKIASVPFSRHHHCSCFYDNKIVVIGGCDPEAVVGGSNIFGPTTTCYALHCSESQWTRYPDLKFPRMDCGVAVVKDTIYVVGGFADSGRLLSSIECYSPTLEGWFELKPGLPGPRTAMGVAEHLGMLWIAGGFKILESTHEHDSTISEVDYMSTSEVICYNPESNTWSKKADLPTARAFLQLVSCNRKLYAIGGLAMEPISSFVMEESSYDNLSSTSDVLVYSEADESWIPTSPMPSPRHGFSAATIGNVIYVLGGIQSTTKKALLNEVVAFDTTSNSWVSCSPLPTPATGLAAVTVPKASTQSHKAKEDEETETESCM